jgi:sialic acid synthase SpsE
VPEQNGFEKLGIGPDKPPKLILDFCWNHEGSIGRVRQMLQVLRDTLTPEQYKLCIPKFQAGRDLPWDRSMYRGVKRMCEEEFGLPFLCTAFDYKAVDMLVSIGVDAIKIGSAEAVDFKFVEYVDETGKALIVSTGGLSKEQIDDLIESAGSRNKLLHCVSQYPAQADMLFLGQIKNPLIDGYSSHYPEVIDGVFAFALGAQVVEKHYSLTPGAQGDHLVSIGPHQAKILCEASLAWHKMRGTAKSQETLDAERALLQPFRERFNASSKEWHDRKFGQPHHGHHSEADQVQGEGFLAGDPAERLGRK